MSILSPAVALVAVLGLSVPPVEPVDLTPAPAPTLPEPEEPAESEAEAEAESKAEGPVEPEGPVVGELSEDGTDSGVLVLGLASVTLATAGALIAFGAVQIKRGQDKQEVCNIDPALNECQIDRPVVRFASAGLSFGLSIPVAVAGALWMRKGVRIRRDYKAFHQGQKVETRVIGQVGRGGANVGLRLRF